MAGDNQWLFTKIVAGALCLVTLISVSIGGANILFDLKRDVILVGKSIEAHSENDIKQWDKAWVVIDKNRDTIQELEVAGGRQVEQYANILRMLGEVNVKIDRAIEKNK